MNAEFFKYALTALFVAVTFWFSFIGMKRTKGLKSFSIGNKDMSPLLVGITMAASISSTATFVINPGFVYNHGFSAYLHYGVGASLGILTAFLLLTKGFRRHGDKTGALTIPDWIFHRYGSRKLSLFFAGINLLSVTFVVLILVGCSILMSSIFPVSQKMALVISLVFVFSYVLMGGTYAHAYTNSFQGLMMVFISLFLFFHGIKYFDGGFFESLQTVGPNFALPFNTESNLYYDFFSVFGSSFIISFALMLQPHIFTKILYLKDDKDITKFISTTIIVGVVFSLMLFIGFYAKLSGLAAIKQDAVVSEYIINEFSGTSWGKYFLTFVTLGLLAAGLSTLDGILVALSSMVVNDIYRPLAGNKITSEKHGLWLSRLVLVVIGLVAFSLAWSPPQFVGLFAQKGVYALAAASVAPIVFGVLLKKTLPIWVVATSSCIGFFGHLYLNLFHGIYNPSVSSSYSIIASIMFMAFCHFMTFGPKLEQAPITLED
ncbi:sodium:solute symporter family protein [Halobacteriovorax sp. GB3]|uniref:sodium:solute symporter family transporter n=1 Tax=Halobacteriovorax sp. GB3 TaxID=2719615 RepID=UPI00236279A7|nr:sodium:solute symporter family protein [Halobacteriovorax sp. GB3]MDD0851818.1 sodium:solute symporter family protein [Halobacteriovorax sp. GB3]